MAASTMGTTNDPVMVNRAGPLLRFAQQLSATVSITAHAPRSIRDTVSAANEDEVRRTAIPELSRLLQAAPQPTAPAPDAQVKVVDRWEGFVSSVSDDVFEGEFVKVGTTEPRLAAVFLLSEVDEDENELVRPGALFYLVSSRVRVSRNRWQPTSAIRFRRLPRVKPDDIEDALAYGEKMRQQLGLTK